MVRKSGYHVDPLPVHQSFQKFLLESSTRGKKKSLLKTGIVLPFCSFFSPFTTRKLKVNAKTHSKPRLQHKTREVLSVFSPLHDADFPNNVLLIFISCLTVLGE